MKMENMPNINMAIKITITIPHFIVKSVGVNIAQTVSPTTMAKNNKYST